MGNGSGYVWIFSDLRNGSSYELIDTELLPRVPIYKGCGGQGWCLGWKESLVIVVGIMEMLVVCKGGESITQELLEETSNEVVGVFIQLGDAVLEYPFMVIQICAHLKIVEALYKEDYIIDMKSWRICVTGLQTTLDCARHSILWCSNGRYLIVCMVGVNICNRVRAPLVKGNKMKAILNCPMGGTHTMVITRHSQ